MVLEYKQCSKNIEMALDEFKFSTNTCWIEKDEPLTTDMTKDKYTGRYRLIINSLFIPNSSPFQTN